MGQHRFETLTLLYLKISLQQIHALDIPHCKLTYYLASGTKATAITITFHLMFINSNNNKFY